MRGFFCALFAGILCLESIGGFCRQGYVSEGIREQATHLFHETAEKEAGQLQEDLHLYAQAAVLLDADSGRVLYGKNEETPMAMASTTKIMTCILVLENAKVEEEVSISAYAATMPKVKLYVKKGEHYTVRELLFSLMLESHNDAAAGTGAQRRHRARAAAAARFPQSGYYGRHHEHDRRRARLCTLGAWKRLLQKTAGIGAELPAAFPVENRQKFLYTDVVTKTRKRG